MSFYRDRPVLVVGGCGFIGTNLVAALVDRGARVTVVTRSWDRHRDYALECNARGVNRLESDVRDADAMAAAVAGQHVIFNLAGRSGAVRSMDDPWTDLDVNGRGMLVLLEALRARNREAKVVFSGSRLEYGRVGPQPIDENHATDPLCLHAVHKLMAQKYLQLYERLFGIRYAVARITNPYGPGQPPARRSYGVVNHLIHLALAGHTLPIYGHGHQRRDYIYIDDVIDALVRLGEPGPSDGTTYNVGTGVGTPMIEMARAIIAIAGGGRIESVEWPALAEQIETGDFVADVSRICHELGWRPTVGLDEGLRRTVAFYRAHAAS